MAKKNDTDTLATVYFRLRDGKKDIKAASELTINPNHWSAEKQGFKDRVALVSEKEKLAFNSHVRNIVTLITQSYTNEADGEWLSETIERYHHPQRFPTEDALAEEIKLQVIPLFDEFLEKHKLSEVRKKNYRVVKRGLQRYELYVRTTKRGQKDFTLYVDEVTSDMLRDIWDFFENEYRYCQLYPAIYDAIPEVRTPQPLDKAEHPSTLESMILLDDEKKPILLDKIKQYIHSGVKGKRIALMILALRRLGYLPDITSSR